MTIRIDKHFYLAHIAPFLFYLAFSKIGFGAIDFGLILTASQEVKNGLLPYRDFHWIVAPLTLYTQAVLQTIFSFLNPITVSALWKGLTYLLLSFVSLVYLQRLSEKLNIYGKFPLFFIYLYPLTFMFLAPIHETYVNYTTDVLFFACLGILFISWPQISADRKHAGLRLLGYLCLGLSVGYKQEIGAVSMAVGLLYLAVQTFLGIRKRQAFHGGTDFLLPMVCLILPMVILLVYFNSQNALNALINSMFVIPLEIKLPRAPLTFSLMTLGTPSLKREAAFMLALFCAILLQEIFPKGSSKDLSSLSSRVTALLKCVLVCLFAIGGIGLGFIILMKPGSEMNPWFFEELAAADASRFLSSEKFTSLFITFYFLVVWTLLVLFLISLIKLLRQRQWNTSWMLSYVMPMVCFLLIFDASALCSVSHIRGPRVAAPLFLAGMILMLFYLKYPLRHIQFSLKRISVILVMFLLVFMSIRIKGLSSPVFADPFDRSVAYSKELQCFDDAQMLENMYAIKRVVSINRGAKVFVYQADTILYHFLDKKPPTFSISHVKDWYPRSLDGKTIADIKRGGVDYAVTMSGHQWEDDFFFRKDDPIREYIEANYTNIYTGEYFDLWKRTGI